MTRMTKTGLCAGWALSAALAVLTVVPAYAQDHDMERHMRHRMMRHEMHREMRHEMHRHMMHRMMRHEMHREMRND
jgi:hypothetical protein